jgi:hypothetical protein
VCSWVLNTDIVQSPSTPGIKQRRRCGFHRVLLSRHVVPDCVGPTSALLFPRHSLSAVAHESMLWCAVQVMPRASTPGCWTAL